MERIDDPTNIIGISDFINANHIDKQINLNDLEKNIMGINNLQSLPETNPVEEFNKAMEQLSLEIPEIKKEVEQEEIQEIQEEIENNKFNELNEKYNNISIYPQQEIKSYQPQNLVEINKKKVENKNEKIKDIISSYRGNLNNNENEEYKKTVLLEDIDELFNELESVHIDVSKIPRPNKEWNYEDIKTVHSVLRRKYDRKRCTSFGSELILTGTQFLEYVFDGERKFGPFSPDLTGWTNVVRPKLRWMRYETSTLISDILNDYNIGIVGRILLELAPSAVLYSYERKRQKNSVYTPMASALNDLRDLN